MAVKADSVTAGKILSATVQYDNSNDTQRTYNIKADVYVSDEAVQNINSGYLTTTTPDGATKSVATFSTFGESNLSVTFNTNEKATINNAIDSILNFIADVKNDVVAKSNNE